MNDVTLLTVRLAIGAPLEAVKLPLLVPKFQTTIVCAFTEHAANPTHRAKIILPKPGDNIFIGKRLNYIEQRLRSVGIPPRTGPVSLPKRIRDTKGIVELPVECP